jgi:nucleotide-binding universal stress UspA family protein
MPTNDHEHPSPVSADSGTLLLVTDPVKDSKGLLRLACQLARKHRFRLELLHVVDPEHVSSMPDGQMAILHRLEELARSMRSLQKGVRAILLFGKPERVVSERAADVNATLIAIALNGSNSDRVQEKLARALAGKCDCPVMTLAPRTPRRRRAIAFGPGGPETGLAS